MNGDKNDIIFRTEWDFVIIDEAHEGNKTELAKLSGDKTSWIESLLS